MRDVFEDDTPAGYRDADIEQAAMEAIGRHESRLRKRGICTHGWAQGQPGGKDGPIECLYCHRIFKNSAEHYAERDKAING